MQLYVCVNCGFIILVLELNHVILKEKKGKFKLFSVCLFAYMKTKVHQTALKPYS